MENKGKGNGFWDRLVSFLIQAIEISETLLGPGKGPEKKERALDLVEKWYRNSGIRIPYLPGPIERWVVKRIAAGMIDSLVEVLNKPHPLAPSPLYGEGELRDEPN